MKRLLALVVVVAGCHGSSPPAFTDALVAPQANGLKVGTSTLDDVLKVYPQTEVKKDKSLGGDGIVAFNDEKGIYVHGGGFEGYVIGGKLTHFELAASGACSWLIQTMDSMKGSTDCPGNRKMGAVKGGGGASYCASAGDRTVWIDCGKGDHEYIEYTLGK
jgi:hypothetical protein